MISESKQSENINIRNKFAKIFEKISSKDPIAHIFYSCGCGVYVTAAMILIIFNLLHLICLREVLIISEILSILIWIMISCRNFIPTRNRYRRKYMFLFIMMANIKLFMWVSVDTCCLINKHNCVNYDCKYGGSVLFGIIWSKIWSYILVFSLSFIV